MGRKLKMKGEKKKDFRHLKKNHMKKNKEKLRSLEENMSNQILNINNLKWKIKRRKQKKRNCLIRKLKNTN